MTQKSIMEKFATMEHERWAKWQKYMHSKMVEEEKFEEGKHFKTGNYVLPKALFERWERQIATPYSELSEEEKQSDRDEVKPYFDHVSTLLQTIESEIEGERKGRVEGEDREWKIHYLGYDEAIDSAKAIISKYKRYEKPKRKN
jgi:hypothetical protein